MTRRPPPRAAAYLTAALTLSAAACAAPSPEAPDPPSTAASLAAELAIVPTDYAKPAHWVCTGASGDLCDEPDGMAVVTTDGTLLRRAWTAVADPGVDCFYVYPTVDWSGGAGNQLDLAIDTLPRAVIRGQAAPFGEVCRVFAPLYRQARLGTYLEGKSPEALAAFRLAFVDVAAAFEYYMVHWNEGRPLVLIGHSQGAQMIGYLLHRWFDGDRPLIGLSGIDGTAVLRQRLVAALPIGFNVFVPRGEMVGGSFASLPLCSEPEQQGCVIHYRSYPEGYARSVGAGGAAGDRALAAEGWLHDVFDPDVHELACVNPARSTLQAGETALVPADESPVEDTAATRVIAESWFWGPIQNLQTGWATTPRDQVFPRRYTATCRDSHLAIGLVTGPTEDARGDPAGTGAVVADNALGLHVADFPLMLGDLVADIQTRIHARRTP